MSAWGISEQIDDWCWDWDWWLDYFENTYTDETHVCH